MTEPKYDIKALIKARANTIAPKGPMPKVTLVKKPTVESYSAASGGASGGFLTILATGLFLTFPVVINDGKISPVLSMPRVQGMKEDETNMKLLGMVRVGDHKDPNRGFICSGIPLGGYDQQGNFRLLKTIETLLEPIEDGLNGHEKELREAGVLIEEKNERGDIITLVNLDMGEYNIPLVYYIADQDRTLVLNPHAAQWSISQSPGNVALSQGTRSQMFRGYVPGNERTRNWVKGFFSEVVKTCEKEIEALPRRDSKDGKSVGVMKAGRRFSPIQAGARSDVQRATAEALAGVQGVQGTSGVEFDEIE